MNIATITVLVAVVALAALAVWRNIRKGAPCECGCGKCDACCHHER